MAGVGGEVDRCRRKALVNGWGWRGRGGVNITKECQINMRAKRREEVKKHKSSGTAKMSNAGRGQEGRGGNWISNRSCSSARFFPRTETSFRISLLKVNLPPLNQRPPCRPPNRAGQTTTRRQTQLSPSANARRRRSDAPRRKNSANSSKLRLHNLPTTPKQPMGTQVLQRSGGDYRMTRTEFHRRRRLHGVRSRRRSRAC